MTPQWYINLRIAAAIEPGAHELVQTGGPGALANAVMGRLLYAVHAICAHKSIRFASAFPLARSGELPHPGNLLRVFIASREEADALLEALEAREFLMGYVLLDRPRKVPQEVRGSVSYALCRTTSRKNINTVTRQRQIERGNALPYVRMHSSSGESFSIRFDVVKRDGAPDTDCKTNGYGLSTRATPCYLPAIPVEDAPWSAAARKLQMAEP
ncbi:type I-F CRISPR-associated endoribonuclease Cas6/Csy4 [Amphibiibacter pelophylacis]|uniref:Type I-F CRISPR-associated endoribonuclease Cas6/Csy4 n=1 Tax=Amphibiibacter pelophylacis TaxID=1799477 RepID=A0ACC6P0Y7_9BURK